MASKCRQNYHGETEALVNKQINIEQSLYYQYLALVSLKQLPVKANCNVNDNLFQRLNLERLLRSR
jgi:hypothetical protein